MNSYVIQVCGHYQSSDDHSCFCVQVIFDNILNRNIPWPGVPEYMSEEAMDLIDRYFSAAMFFISILCCQVL